MNGWASILSTIAGAALFFGKSANDGKGGGKNTSTKTTSDTLDTVEESYKEYKEKVEEAQAQQQANDPRNSSVYFGDKTAPYDPFYDYSNDDAFFTPLLIDNNATDEARVRTLRARFVAPYLLSKEVMHEDSTAGRWEVIGCNVFSDEEKAILKNSGQERNYYQRYIYPDLYKSEQYQSLIVDGDEAKYVANMARGNFRYVTFYVEILNPTKYPTKVAVAGIDNVKVGETRCQPIHLGALIPKGELMGEAELAGRYYMYDAADKMDHPYGNVGFFSAIELRADDIKSNGQITPSKWMKMGYPYVLCDDFANNGYQNQEWGKIYKGQERVGWATEPGKKEYTLTEQDGRGNYKSVEYSPSYLVIEGRSSRIVKITLPLASIEDSSAVYIPEEKLFKYDAQRGKVVEIYSYDGIADSDLHDCNYKFLSTYAYEFYQKMHEYGIKGYVKYDFKPAPSLINKSFSLKLTLCAEEGHYLEENAAQYRASRNVQEGVSFELVFQHGKRPSTQTSYKHSYIEDQDIPFESQDRQTQLALINKKFNFKYEQTFEEAFDASANN